jgi:hypothetical protein
MKLPQVSVRAIAYLILLLALDLAWVVQIERPGFGYSVRKHYLDLPLLGLLNILAIAGYPLLVGRTRRPFLSGLVGGGLLWAAAYAILFYTYPTLANVSYLFMKPIEAMILPPVFTPLNPGYGPKYFSLLAVVALCGAIPLLALSALLGLLNWLVARGKLPRTLAVAIVVCLMGTTVVELRWVEYGQLVSRYEDAEVGLSSEVVALSKRLEILRSTEDPTRAEVQEKIASLEGLDRRNQALTEVRRSLVKYRQVVRRPWLPVGD